jgi:alpha-ribazole phosphatase
MKLWLVRHARVLVKAGICYGSSEVFCDDSAVEEAANAFANCPAYGSMLWTSPSVRSTQLAMSIKSKRQDLIGPKVDDRLREMNFGKWEMHAWDDIPLSEFDAWTADFPNYRFGGKESTQEVIDRIANALQQVLSMNTSELVWITHAGVIKAVQFLSPAMQRKNISSAKEWPIQSPATGTWVCIDCG